jgi:hypothetical protein
MDRTVRELTKTETAALHAFAAAHGRKWKATLADVYWYNARIWEGHHCLHALRNDSRWSLRGLRAYRI